MPTSPLTRLPLSAYRISKLTGIADSHVARILTTGGQVRATLESAIKIAHAAGVTLDELAEVVYGRSAEMQRAKGEIDRRKRAWEAEDGRKASARAEKARKVS